MKFVEEFRKMNIEDKYDIRLSLVFCVFIFGIAITTVTNAFFDDLNSYVFSSKVSNINKALLFALLFLNFRPVFTRLNRRIIIFSGAVFLAYLLSFVLIRLGVCGDFNTVRSCTVDGNEVFVSYSYLKGTFLSFFLTIFPVMVVIFEIKNYGILLSMAKYTSYLTILLAFIVPLFRDSAYSYNMGYSNALIVPILISLYFSFYGKLKERIISVISFVSGTFCIVAYGSRGPLLCIFTFFVIILFKFLLENNKKVLLILYSLAILLFTAFLNVILKYALKVLSVVFSALGTSSRTLEYAEASDILNLSLREDIYEAMVKGIKESPFLIRGISSEYFVTGGVYSHNFVLGLLYEFGVLFGGVLLVVIALFVIKAIGQRIKGNNEGSQIALCLIFACASLPLLLVSYSLWTYSYFWFFIVLFLKRPLKLNFKQFYGKIFHGKKRDLR